MELDDSGRSPSIDLKLAKAVPKVDPNAEIQAEVKRAAGLMEGQKFAEARKVRGSAREVSRRLSAEPVHRELLHWREEQRQSDRPPEDGPGEGTGQR